MVKLSSGDVSPIDMSVPSRWVIRPRLLGVPGVAKVTIWGQRERQLQVLVYPEVLQANGVTLQDVISTTANVQRYRRSAKSAGPRTPPTGRSRHRPSDTTIS
jgi:multidrug efflux pump subunit AcrB